MPSTEAAKNTLKQAVWLRDFIQTAKIDTKDGCKNQKSLQNMLYYLKLREIDNTDFQESLSRLGLSSLGRSQAHILYSLDLIIEILSKCNHVDFTLSQDSLSIDDAQMHRAKRATIFGANSKPQKTEETKIMLTLPSQAAQDTSMIEEFAKVGVNIFRINTAHDDEASWRTMAGKIKELNATVYTDNRLRVYVDLAGPKIRTGKIRKIKESIKLMSSQKIFITSNSLEFIKIPSDALKIVVDDKFYKKAKNKDEINILTANGKSRLLSIIDIQKGYLECELSKKIEVDEDTILFVGKKDRAISGKILNLPEATEEICLQEGDRLFLSLNEICGHGKITTKDSVVEKDAAIYCTQKEFVEDAKVGDKVFIDDGKIGLTVAEKSPDGLLCVVVQARVKGEILKEEKGINFPDSNITVSAITDEDRNNIDCIAEFADIIGVSFVQNGNDIETIRDILRYKNKENIAIVAKIETKQAVKNLPLILKALSYHELSGVMLARGDLAIEVEFENMSYLQEEIFDLCEAAHMPVIFATQVLENQMKNNLPSRAEITDAAYSQRADCVMLNKGVFALNTIKKLEFILSKMHTIYKKIDLCSGFAIFGNSNILNKLLLFLNIYLAKNGNYK